jgi:signal transduction histidine kinase
VLSLLGRRRFPFGAPVSVWVLAPAFSFVDGHVVTSSFTVYLAGIAAAVLLGNLRDVRQARIGLAIVIAGAVIVVHNKPASSAGDYLFIPGLFAVAWLAGFALRARSSEAEAAEQRAAEAEREQQTTARIAVAEERARIARELHDVVAHAVSVMVLQVGAVRHRLPADLSDSKEALQGVEQAGRAALAEMRQLLGAMRDTSEDAELAPQPGLDDLDDLLDEVRRAGLRAQLRVEGAGHLPRGIDLSAYRIVQEGLTNTLKHAHAHSAEVTIRYEEDRVEIAVRDDGTGPARTDGLGHGLVGVRERVKIYGGHMTSGPAPGGGFLLSACIPVDRADR